MSVWLPPSLLSLFVFNPSLGNEDTESAKLLYYYPPSTPLNSQKDAVGLIEAICGFSAQLVGDRGGGGADCMRGDEELHTVLQCEPGYYVVCVMKHSSTATKAAKGGTAGGSGGDRRLDWHDEDIDEQSVRQQLSLAYHSFRCLNGSFASCAAEQSMDGLRARLDLFFRFWLPSIPFASLHLLSPLQGYQYLPVDSITYLTIQLLVNNIKANFPNVAAVSFLHDARLVYTDVQGADMEALYALTSDSRQSLQSYLAINEELSNRLREAALSSSSASSTAAANAANGSSNASRSEASESDIFLLPQSMYEKMAVKHYRGPQYNETTDADFMTAQRTAQQQQQQTTTTDRKDGLGGASKRDKRGKRTDGSAASSSTSAPSSAGAGPNSTSSPASLPVGFLTGPYRSPLPASSLPFTSGAWSSLNSPMWTSPLPLTLEDRACVDSPRLFLQPGWRGEAADDGDGDGKLHRLLMYRRHAITLLFVVSCQSASPSSNNSPPLSLYDTLESFMHSTLKKIAMLLNTASSSNATALASSAVSPQSQSAAQSTLSHPSAASSSTSSSSSLSVLSPSSAVSADGGYRFLYYNSMNLVLACTWDVHQLPLEAVRGVRECQHALMQRRSVECVLRLKGGQWVAARRAAATQRHFIALFDERLSSLQDVQREMDQLTRALFHNVCFE